MQWQMANNYKASLAILALLGQAQVPALAQTNQSISTTAPVSAVTDPATESARSSLLKANYDFHNDYVKAKKEIIAKANPIMIVEGDNLVLFLNGERQQTKFVPDIWHALKEVDHIALAAYVMLVNHCDTSLDNQTIQTLTEYRKAVQAVRANLNQLSWSDANLKDYITSDALLVRQKQIVDATQTFIDSALSDKQMPTQTLIDFCRRMTPLVMANADDAEVIEMSNLNTQVQNWKNSMSSTDWDNIHVVIMGGHMPHDQDRNIQYFSKVLHEEHEGNRWIYLEVCPDEASALDSLATHLLDRQIGKAFFNNPDRMHRDLLSDSAKKYLDKHPIK
jgi:hypothetical protein